MKPLGICHSWGEMWPHVLPAEQVFDHFTAFWGGASQA